MEDPIDEQRLIEAVREVIAEHGPDYVYEDQDENGDCRYSADDGVTGSCLYGEVLIEKMGVPYEDWWEGKPITAVLSNLGHVWSGARASELHYGTQREQDERQPYEVVGQFFENTLRYTLEEAWS